MTLSLPSTASVFLAMLIATATAAAPARAAAVSAPSGALAQVELLVSKGRTQRDEAIEGLLAIEKASPPDSVALREAMVARGALLAARRDFDAAESIASQFDAWNRREPSAIVAASAMLVRGRMAERRGDAKALEPLAVQSLAMLPADAPVLVKLRHVRMLGLLRTNTGKFEEAIRLWHQAVALADETGNAIYRVGTRSTLSYTYFLAGQRERALRANAEATQIAEQGHDLMSLAMVHNTNSILYDGDAAVQRKSLQAALDYAHRAGAKHEEALYLANISDLMIAVDPEAAIAYAGRALRLAHELQDVTVEIGSTMNMGLAHIALRHLDTGKDLVARAIALEHKSGWPAVVPTMENELGKALERVGDTAGAVAAFHAHRRDADALLQSGTQKKVLAIQEQFDAEQRSARLELLGRENALKDEQLRHNALMQRLWLLLAVVLTLSISGLSLLYRRVRRTNQALAASNLMLKVQGERDPLTGLANRRYFRAAMQTHSRDGHLEGTVCVLDVDHFKRINDTHGHAAGDAVLAEVAQRLRRALRDDDLIVRWGGEEFLLVLRAVTPEQVDALVGRLLHAVGGAPVQVDGHEIAITVSIGFASFPLAPAQTPAGWECALRLVDAAMYMAKSRGRNRAIGVTLPHARTELEIDAVAAALDASTHGGLAVISELGGPVHSPAFEAVEVPA